MKKEFKRRLAVKRHNRSDEEQILRGFIQYLKYLKKAEKRNIIITRKEQEAKKLFKTLPPTFIVAEINKELERIRR